MSTSSFTAQHFHDWYSDAYGPYNSWRSGTRGPTGGTGTLNDKHAYRGLAWFDASAVTTALSGQRVTGIAITYVSQDWTYESAADTAVRIYITDLTYNAGNDGYNSADDVRWTLGMTAANPYNSHMIEYGTTAAIEKGATLTAGSFATGDQAERFATALKAGYALGTFELKPGTNMSQDELYKVRSTTTAPVIVITHEAASTDCTPPTSAALMQAYSRVSVTIAFAGAIGGGTGHTIAGYQYKYAESADGTTWGAYSAASATQSETAGDGEIIAPVGAGGVYRKYQIATVSEDTSVTAFVDVDGVVLNPVSPDAPDVDTVTSGLHTLYSIVCGADDYGLWTSVKRAVDGGTAEVIQAVPPAGGTFIYSENLAAGAHTVVFTRWNLFGGYSADETESFTCTAMSEAGQGWLKWNGANSLDYNIVVLDQPEPTKPAERITYEKVLGREGHVYVNEADDVYDTLEKTAMLYIKTGDFDAARAWLKGSGTVEFGNEPGYIYNAYISSVIAFERITRGHTQKRAAVTFVCQPCKFDADETAQIYTISGGYITNLGNVQAKPLVTVNGAGDLTLTIGDETMAMAGVVSSVTLDCLEMVAVDEDGNDYTALTGDFFRVPVGTSQITWTGGVTSVSILPRWGYI